MNRRSIVALLKNMFNLALLKETYHEWSNDKASRLAAALAYYTATAMAPLIIGVLAIAGFVFSREQAQLQLVSQIRTYVGSQGAEIVESILANADQPDLARLAGIFSLVALLWSASNIFAQLQDSLDTIWGVQLRKDLSWMRKIQHKILPLLTVVGIGLLLLVAAVASTVLSAAGAFVTDLIPGGTIIWQIVNFLISLTVIALMFGVVFKVLPDVDIAWSDVWPGAALTSLLFVVGQFALGWYLGRQSGASVYGAAGSLIILLLWLYYSAQIFLFGAEFTQVYATRYGEGVRPAKDAVAREDGSADKPAAQAAHNTEPGQQPQTTHRPQSSALQAQRVSQSVSHPPLSHPLSYPQSRQASIAAYDDLSLGGLIGQLIDDGRNLFRQEIALARAEIGELVGRLSRGVAMVAGGGFVVYAGALFVLLALPLLLWSLQGAYLWIALLLVGFLLAVLGWILFVAAQGKLKRLGQFPKQTVDSLRQDVETVKGHLVN